MKLRWVEPVRRFQTGPGGRVTIAEVALVSLEPDEQISLRTNDAREYDIVCKKWGYYATPSINARLKKFGWRTCLVLSSERRLYVMLVSEESRSEFDAYCLDQELSVVAWLDALPLEGISTNISDVLKDKDSIANPVCFCGCRKWVSRFTFTKRPPKEVAFSTYLTSEYRRELLQCDVCNHFISRHSMGSSFLYDGDYTTSNYGAKGLKSVFDAILSLPHEESDNYARAMYVIKFVESWSNLKSSGIHKDSPSIVDIGSGLCVFLWQIQESRPNWKLTALDSDAAACEHARQTVGINAICGDITRFETTSRFDCVSLIKVLEHSEDPYSMLMRAIKLMKTDGLLYIEVPNGLAAWKDGPDREEFTIDHPNIFSPESLVHLVHSCGLNLVELQTLREPSSKYTIRAFTSISA